MNPIPPAKYRRTMLAAVSTHPGSPTRALAAHCGGGIKAVIHCLRYLESLRFLVHTGITPRCWWPAVKDDVIQMADPLPVPEKPASPYDVTLIVMQERYGPVRTWARERHAEHTDLMQEEAERRGIRFKGGKTHPVPVRAAH